MSDFLRFWWQSIRHAFSAGWAVFGLVSAIIPDTIALIQRHVTFLASAGWMTWVSDNQVELRLAFAGAAILAYLVYAPYKLYRETRATAAREVEAARAELNAAVERISRLEGRQKLTVSFAENGARGLLCARVVNGGDREERVMSLAIHHADSDGSLKRIGKIKEFRRCEKLPHVMPPRSSFDAVFLLSEGTFLSYGIPSYFARLVLEDETTVDSPEQRPPRDLSPLQIRIRLGEIKSDGKTILEKWKEGDALQRDACKRWHRGLDAFAKEHFKISQYDKLKEFHVIHGGDAFDMYEQLPDTMSKDSAIWHEIQELAAMLEKIEKAMDEITD
jgi:hypothetical protein